MKPKLQVLLPLLAALSSCSYPVQFAPDTANQQSDLSICKTETFDRQVQRQYSTDRFAGTAAATILAGPIGAGLAGAYYHSQEPRWSPRDETVQCMINKGYSVVGER